MIFKLIEMCEDNKTKATPVVRTKDPISDHLTYSFILGNLA